MRDKIRKESGFCLFILILVIYALLWFHFSGGQNIISDGAYYHEYFVRIFIRRDLPGSGLIKYPIGPMVMELPFLLAAYYISLWTGIDLEGGFSRLFQMTVFTAALFYCVIGLCLIYRMLRKRYSQNASLWSCICLYAGTMLPVYVMDKSSFAHAYGFFGFTAAWVYIAYYERTYPERSGFQKTAMDLCLGGLLGLNALIRNTNVVIGAAYLFFGVYSLRGLAERVKTRIIGIKLPVQITGFIAVFSIQVIAWKIMTGSWMLYGYVEESFSNILHPHIRYVLFSDAKGLLIFSPVLIIALAAMVIWRKDNREYGVATWVILIAEILLIASWWCWWLGNAYGERMICDVLCIFAIPFASFFEEAEKVRKRSAVGKTGGSAGLTGIAVSVCYLFAVIFICWNLIMIRGARAGVISENFATWFQIRSWLVRFLF